MNHSELRRQLWLEITPQRLLALPAILTLLLLTLFLTVNDNAFWKSLSYCSLSGFVIFTVFWGGKQVGDAMSDEFTEATWDTQRIGGLDALEMCVGKLFGAACYAWYGGLWLTALYVLAEVKLGQGALLLQGLPSLAAAALLAHALALNSALLSFRRLGRASTRRPPRGGFVLLLVLVVPNLITALWRSERSVRDVEWYGLQLPMLDFATLSLIAFAGWALTSAYRNMRLELQFRNQPWVWLGFMAFLIVYLGGFVPDTTVPALAESLGEAMSQPLLLRLALGSGLAVLLAYGGIFTERKDPIRLARLVEHLKMQQWRQAAEQLPLWSVNLALAAALGAALVIAGFSLLTVRTAIELLAGIAALLLFAVRDFALVLWCNFGKPVKRADASALVYLGVLYFVLPMLLSAFGGQLLMGLTLPYASFSQPIWVLAGMAWAAAGLDLLRRRWRALPQLELALP